MMNLTTDRFQKSIESHLDKTKPDTAVRRQAQQLAYNGLRWQHTSKHGDEGHKDTTDNDCSDRFCEGVLSVTRNITADNLSEDVKDNFGANAITGGVVVVGDDKVVDLDGAATVSVYLKADLRFDPTQGFLKFSLRASAKIGMGSTNDNKRARKKGRKSTTHCTSIKTQEKIVQKLSADYFIKKITSSKSCLNDGGALLCEVEIKTNTVSTTIGHSDDQQCTEQRVNVESDILEAVRRASFSHMETNIDLISLLVELPWLSSSEVLDCYTLTGNEEIANELFERAALYLLEDALVDECDREGESELLYDLTIDEESDVADEDSSKYDNHVIKKMRGK